MSIETWTVRSFRISLGAVAVVVAISAVAMPTRRVDGFWTAPAHGGVVGIEPSPAGRSVSVRRGEDVRVTGWVDDDPAAPVREIGAVVDGTPVRSGGGAPDDRAAAGAAERRPFSLRIPSAGLSVGLHHASLWARAAAGSRKPLPVAIDIAVMP